MDVMSITNPATWPAFNAQSSQSMYAIPALMRWCVAEGRQDLANMHHAWKVALLPEGSVVQTKGGHFLYLLGGIGQD
eukprot:3947079-Lingulodinium_polyedra.AAC.1